MLFNIVFLKILFSIFLFITLNLFLFQILLINTLKKKTPMLYKNIFPNLLTLFYFIITPLVNFGPDIQEVLINKIDKDENMPENIKVYISLIRIIGILDSTIFIIAAIVIFVILFVLKFN